MANIGDQLIMPEAGWARYDDRDSAIKYTGEIDVNTAPQGKYYNSSRTWLRKGSSLTFSFLGSKVRILGSFYRTGRSEKNDVYVNGALIGSFNLIRESSIDGNFLVWEKDFGTSEIREIKIVNNTTSNDPGVVTVFDAIDINEQGQLIPELSKDYEFPVKTIEKVDVEPYAASCMNGEEQLLIAIEDGSQYLTRGDGTYTACGVTKEKYNELEARVLALEELLKQPQ